MENMQKKLRKNSIWLLKSYSLNHISSNEYCRRGCEAAGESTHCCKLDVSMQQSNLKKEDNNLAIAHNSFNSCRNLKEIRSFSLNFKVGSVLTMVKVVKVPNQHLPRVRNGRVVRPAPAAVPGPSPSSRRKSTRNVAQQKEKRSSFFVPHLDQEYKQKVNQIARTYNIYVGIAKNKQNLMAKLTLFSGFRN